MRHGHHFSGELYQALTEWREVKLAFTNRPPGANAALASLERLAEVEDRMLVLISEMSRSMPAGDPRPEGRN